MAHIKENAPHRNSYFVILLKFQWCKLQHFAGLPIDSGTPSDYF